MSANLTVGYMTEQINRGRLASVAARGWLAKEAAMTRPRAERPPQGSTVARVALVRLAERIQGTMRPVGTVADLNVPPVVLVR